MGLFKVLGVVALGFVAVAAAPVTLTGVAVAAGIGATAAVASSASEKKKRASSDRDAYERGRAERVTEFENLEQKFAEAAKRFKSHKKYEEFLLAAFAVAIAAAHADGEFNSAERSEIEEIVSGESYNALPDEVRNQIQHLFLNPPNFSTAMILVKKVAKSKWSVFDTIIELVIASDGVENTGETAFIQAWKEFKAS